MIETILFACAIALILVAVFTTQFGFVLGCLIVGGILAFVVGGLIVAIELLKRGARRIVRGFY